MAYEVVAVTAGAGTNIVCDQTSSGYIQVVKLDFGADGAESLVSGSMPIQDGGNSITVDGTVAVTDGAGSVTVDAPVGTPVFVRLSDGSSAIATLPVSLASVPSHAVTNAGTFAVQVDGAALTALQLIDNVVLAEDAAHVSGDPGVQALAVRSDSDASFAGTTGDYAPLQLDANGFLKVNIKAGAGSGGTASTDDAAFTAASGSGTPMMGFVTADAVDAGDAGVVGMTANRALYTTLRTPNNDSAMDDTNDALRVNIVAGGGAGGTSATDDAAFTPAAGAGTPIMGFADETSPDAVDEGDVGVVRMTLSRALHVNLRDSAGAELTVGGATQYAEDAGHVSGDQLTMAGAVRRDTAAAGSGTDGDNSTLNVNSVGRLWTTAVIDTALPAGTNNIGDVDILSIAAGDNNIGNVDIVTLPNVTLAAGTNTNEVVGDAAHDAAVAGNPVLVGLEARSTDGTAVTSGDVSRVLGTLLGKQVNYPYALPGSTWNYAAAAGGLVNTTGVTAKTAAGAGIRNYITSCQVINSHQTTGTEVLIRDGAAGTVLHRGWAQPAGGGFACKFDPPLRGTANTLIEIAEVTTTATAGVLVNLQGFTAAE